MHRIVLQCDAVCCSVLQCVAVCYSVLQCVAMCCTVFSVGVLTKYDAAETPTVVCDMTGSYV